MLKFSSEGPMTVDFSFLEKTLTEQAIHEGIIGPNEVVTINSIEIDNEDRVIISFCEVFHHVYN